MTWVTGGFGRVGTQRGAYVTFGLGRSLSEVFGPLWDYATTRWFVRTRLAEPYSVRVRTLASLAVLRETTSLGRVRTTVVSARSRIATWLVRLRNLLFLD